MNQNDIIDLFHELDYSEIINSLKIVNYRFVDENFCIEQYVGDYYVSITFNLQGTHYVDYFHLQQLFITKDKQNESNVVVYIDEHDMAVINESSLSRIEKVLKTKIKQL
jgi:hypothetical protein